MIYFLKYKACILILMFDNNIEIHSDLRLVPSGNNISILKPSLVLMRLNRIDICSSIDFDLISPTGFTAPFAFFSPGIPLKAVFSCIIHRVYYQISIAKLDLGLATATVSLHVDLHNEPYQCLYHYLLPFSVSLFRSN